MSQIMLSVGTLQAGSTTAESGSGMSSMSLSLIFWKPRMDEPSKPRPSAKVSSVSSVAGMEKCCQVPGMSMNLTSTILRPWSLTSFRTSAGVDMANETSKWGDTAQWYLAAGPASSAIRLISHVPTCAGCTMEGMSWYGMNQAMAELHLMANREAFASDPDT